MITDLTTRKISFRFHSVERNRYTPDTGKQQMYMRANKSDCGLARVTFGELPAIYLRYVRVVLSQELKITRRHARV